MPMLRWLGFRRVTSLLPMTIEPEVGSSKPATILSTVDLPQPEGPRNETNSPAPISRLKSWTTVLLAKALRMLLTLRNGSAMAASAQFVRLVRGALRDRSWMSDMQPQVMTKAMMASAAG